MFQAIRLQPFDWSEHSVPAAAVTATAFSTAALAVAAASLAVAAAALATTTFAISTSTLAATTLAITTAYPSLRVCGDMVLEWCHLPLLRQPQQ